MSKVYQLLEPGPVVLLTTAREGRANVMTMSWADKFSVSAPVLILASAQRWPHLSLWERALVTGIWLAPGMQHRQRRVIIMPRRSKQSDEPGETVEPALTISPEKVCFIIIKMREFDAKDELTEPDPGSNPTDDRETAVLEDHEDDPVVEELSSLINSLSEDEQIDLVALAWLGREDYSAADWPSVRDEAALAHNDRTADYLLGTPLLGDFLEEGLSMLGYSCEDFEIGRL